MAQSVTHLTLDQGIPGSSPGRPANPQAAVVRQLLIEGVTYAEITRRTGVSKATISYHAKKLGRSRQKQYDWKAIQSYHDAGHRYVDCKRHFGFTSAAWARAIQRGDIIPREWRLSHAELFVKDSKRSPGHLKERAIADGVVEQKCYSCGIGPMWNGKPLTLWLDHANGDGDDWRKENLRMVCPNCDSQSETFAGRNVRRPNAA